MALPILPQGWDSGWVEAIATVAGAVFTFLTTIVAVLVYLEAKAIRKTEWFAKTAENWQAFNRLVIEADYAPRWAGIIKGDILWKDLEQRDFMFIYSFLNVLIFEFKAKDSHLLDRRYVEKSVGDNILYFRHIWTELRPHLGGDGWPEDFLPIADETIAAAEAVRQAMTS